MNVHWYRPPGPRTIDWMALPATSPPRIRTLGLYTLVDELAEAHARSVQVGDEVHERLGHGQTIISARARSAAAINAAARTGSTGFQVTPSRLRCVPTIAPSAAARISFTVSAVTPGLASTGAWGRRLWRRGGRRCP